MQMFTRKGRHYIRERIPVTQRIWWTSRSSTDLWYEKNPGECGSMYFPYAESFMTKFPWLAVRVFWVCLMVKRVLLEYQKLGHYDYF